ncbi:MAG: glycoside hydrolase, partial [Bacteroidota bacterium]
VYFAMKGFRAAACSWRNPEVASQQVETMVQYRQQSTDGMQANFQGMIQTIWSGADNFLDEFYGRVEPTEQKNTPVACFKALYDEIEKFENE